MIKELHVDKFRAMVNLAIPLGKKVTVIAGQNATCKSTILGMIGQPFGLKNERTIFDKPFSTKFFDIFKWSKKNDVPGEHKYRVYFYDDSLFGKTVEHVKSYKRSEKDNTHLRLVVGKKRGRGDGNLDYPVIYLGLKRVYPIGELKDISESRPTLTVDEITAFNDWYKRVFFPSEATCPVQITSKQQKDTLAINSDKYDYLANSAGQDNIGQILGAILSFYRLKNKLGVEYRGGLLLIDELDATLFPAAQINLIDLFYNLAGKLKLQFIFTTHSLDALGHIIDGRKHNSGDTEILYFTRVYGKLDLISEPSMERIRSDLNMTAIMPGESPKLNVYCEDAEASWFIKRLLGRQRTKYLKFCDATFGGDFLYTLAQKHIPEFDNSLIVLDGDKSVPGSPANVLFLPGRMNPENVFRTFLQNLDPNDPFWHNEQQYTKQVFERQLCLITQNQYGNREKMKEWFNNEKKFWGHGASKIYKRWVENNQDEATAFTESFIQAYSNIAKRRSIPTIS